MRLNLSGRFSKLLPLLAILLVIGLAVYFICGNRAELVKLPSDDLPSLEYDSSETDPDLLVPGVYKLLEDTLQLDVEIKAESGDDESIEVQNLLLAWRKLPDLEFDYDIEEQDLVAREIFALDQLYLGQALVESGRGKQFKKWQDSFEKAFGDDESGLHASSLIKDIDGFYRRDNANWITTQGYLRVLLQAYMLKPSSDLENSISVLSDTLLPIFKAGPPPHTAGLGPNFQHPLISTMEGYLLPPDQEEVPLIALENIDFWLLRQLGAFNPEWEDIYKTWHNRIENYQYEIGMPFPPEGWNTTDDTAMPLISSDFQVDTRRLLKTSLHLAEIRVSNDDFIAFILDEISNGPLALSYHLLNGSGNDYTANPALVAWAGRLGRAVDNRSLFEVAMRQLQRNYISDQASQFFGGYARRDQDNRLTIYALDQVLAILAMQ